MACVNYKETARFSYENRAGWSLVGTRTSTAMCPAILRRTECAADTVLTVMVVTTIVTAFALVTRGLWLTRARRRRTAVPACLHGGVSCALLLLLIPSGLFRALALRRRGGHRLLRCMLGDKSMQATLHGARCNVALPRLLLAKVALAFRGLHVATELACPFQFAHVPL